MIKNLIIEFEEGNEIGQNGFNSKVFEAYETKLKRTIAMKRILKKDLKTNYYEEAVLLNESQHPNVVDIHYAGEGKGLDEDGVECEYVYLAMPLYKNGSLQEVIKKEKTLIELCEYVFGILNGLLHIHTKGILHLDLKPDNILISDKDDALITDFGVATQFDIETSMAKNKKSLFPFITAPETVINKEVAIQSDIYQIGILLYLLFNKIDINVIRKQFDFSKEKRKETAKEIQTLIINDQLYKKDFIEHIPDKIKNIILKCMKINPNDRYKSVEELRNEFASIKEDEKRLLWSYYIIDDDRIWTRTIDSMKEICIMGANGSISYKIYKNNSFTKEEIIKENLKVFFNKV